MGLASPRGLGRPTRTPAARVTLAVPETIKRRGKILHLIPTLEGGGAERQLAYLGSGLRDRGWDITVASLRRGVNTELLVGAGVRLLPIKNASPRDPLLLPRILRLIRGLDPDIVHTWLPSMDLLGGISTSLLRVPWVASERSQPDAWPPGIRTRSRQSLILKRARILVTNSETAVARYLELGAREALVRCVPNGIPLEHLRSAVPADRSVVGARDDVKLIMVVGRRSEQKNLEAIIRALPRVVERIPIVLLVFGVGPLRALLEALVRDQGLEEHVRFEGFSDAIPGWLHGADLFLSASQVEGSPNAVMEAMACGCPMVLSDIEEHQELAGDGALYFEPTDPAALAGCVMSALSNTEASVARSRIASDIIEAFTVEKMVSHYEEIYSAIVRDVRGGVGRCSSRRASDSTIG